jgi:TonB family protein
MNSKRNKYDALFTPSGCLTSEAMNKYRDLTLDAGEKSVIEKHLSECNLCSDAMDGLQIIKNPERISSNVAEINRNLNDRLARESVPKKQIIKRILYLSAAASVLILVGLFVFLKLNKTFKFEKISEVTKTELSEKIPPVPVPREADIHTMNKEEKKTSLNEKALSKPVDQKNGTIESINKEQEIIPEIENKETKTNQVIVYEDVIEEKKDKDAPYNADETVEPETIDIASIQPVEFYLGGVIIRAENTKKGRISTAMQEKSGEADFIGGVAVESETSRQALMQKSTRTENKVMGADEVSKVELNSGLQRSNHFFKAIDTMPEFPGGTKALNDFLKKNLHYPAIAIENQIEGTLFISFIVEENGETSSVTILRSLDSSCDEEALRVVGSMPDWKPGYKEGKPVRVQINLPIKFQLY